MSFWVIYHLFLSDIYVTCGF